MKDNQFKTLPNSSIPLLIYKRNNIIENVYRGIIAVVDYNGKIIKKAGNIKTYCYMRSIAKPLQALVVVKNYIPERFNLTDKELAIICASHNGEKQHIDIIKKLLVKTNISETKLKCGCSYPLNEKERIKMQIKGNKPKVIYHNCCGKHIGMLLLCKKNKYPLDNYNSINHPVQKNILQIISDLVNMKKEEVKIGIDGCSVPTFAIPFYKIAMAFAKLAHFDDKNIKKIRNAMRNNPYIISGKNGIDTILMQSNKNIISKGGAQNIQAIGISNKKIGIAVKIESGKNNYIQKLIVSKILKQLKIKTSLKEDDNIYNNRGQKVGRIESVFKL